MLFSVPKSQNQEGGGSFFNDLLGCISNWGWRIGASGASGSLWIATLCHEPNKICARVVWGEVLVWLVLVRIAYSQVWLLTWAEKNKIMVNV